MTKMILAALALASGVSSAAVISAKDFSCYDLRKEITRNGFQIVDGKVLYPDNTECSGYAATAWVTTGEGWTCPAGVQCLDSNPNASLTAE